MDAIPMVDVAMVTGSTSWGIAVPEDVDLPGVRVIARDLTFETPYGLSHEWKLIELDGSLTFDGKTRNALVVWSHGNRVDEIDHSGQRRAFWVLREAGVRKVLCCATQGSLNRAIQAGDFVIVADVLELTQTPYSLLPGRQRFDASGKQLVCPSCAATVARVAGAQWPEGRRVFGIESQLVAAHAWGPRLSSPAEVLAYRTLGADIINHSLAPEATLSREIGACFVNVGYVTAPFQGYFAPADVNVVRGDVRDDLVDLATRVAIVALAEFDLDAPCHCAGLRSAQPENRWSRR